MIYQQRYIHKGEDRIISSRKSSLFGTNLAQRGMKLQHLRLIAQLHETAQISAAAAAMNISQPAASRLIRELEIITGVRLYRRHPRGIELTDYGARLALRARSIVQDLQDAGREIAEFSSGEAGAVNMGAVTGPAIEMVLPALKRMRMSHARVETSVIVDISDVMAQDLMSNRIDFYIGRIPMNADARLFHTDMIGKEPAALIVRCNHPLASQEGITIADCLSYDWVMQTQDSLLNQTLEQYLSARGLRLPKMILRTSSPMLILATIIETNAIAPIALSVAGFFGEEGELGSRIKTLPVAPELAVSPYALIKRANSILSPAAQIFYDYLIEYAT